MIKVENSCPERKGFKDQKPGFDTSDCALSDAEAQRLGHHLDGQRRRAHYLAIALHWQVAPQLVTLLPQVLRCCAASIKVSIPRRAQLQARACGGRGCGSSQR